MAFCGDLMSPEYLVGVRGLIFDCDGVLFDSLASNIRYYNTIKAKLGLEPMDEDQARFVHMHAVQASLAYIVPKGMHHRIEEARASVDYNSEILPFLIPEPGLYELLAWLKRVGTPLAISTNRTTTMDMVVSRFGLQRFFFPVVTATQVWAKPHPEGVYKILRQWRMAPAEVAYIGDSEVDEATAQAAGVAFWAYKNENLPARLHIRDFWSLRRSLKKIFPSAPCLDRLRSYE